MSDSISIPDIIEGAGKALSGSHLAAGQTTPKLPKSPEAQPQQPGPQLSGSGDDQDKQAGEYFDKNLRGDFAKKPGMDIPVLGDLAHSSIRGDYIKQQKHIHNLGSQTFNPFSPVDWVTEAQSNIADTYMDAQRMTRMFGALFGDNPVLYHSLHDNAADHHSLIRRFGGAGINDALDGVEALDAHPQTHWIVEDLIPNLLTSTVKYAPLMLGGEALAGAAMGARLGEGAMTGAEMMSKIPGAGTWAGKGAGYLSRLTLLNAIPAMLLDGAHPEEVMKQIMTSFPSLVGEILFGGTAEEKAGAPQDQQDQAHWTRMGMYGMGAMMFLGGRHSIIERATGHPLLADRLGRIGGKLADTKTYSVPENVRFDSKVDPTQASFMVPPPVVDATGTPMPRILDDELHKAALADLGITPEEYDVAQAHHRADDPAFLVRGDEYVPAEPKQASVEEIEHQKATTEYRQTVSRATGEGIDAETYAAAHQRFHQTGTASGLSADRLSAEQNLHDVQANMIGKPTTKWEQGALSPSDEQQALYDARKRLNAVKQAEGKPAPQQDQRPPMTAAEMTKAVKQKANELRDARDERVFLKGESPIGKPYQEMTPAGKSVYDTNAQELHDMAGDLGLHGNADFMLQLKSELGQTQFRNDIHNAKILHHVARIGTMFGHDFHVPRYFADEIPLEAQFGRLEEHLAGFTDGDTAAEMHGAFGSLAQHMLESFFGGDQIPEESWVRLLYGNTRATSDLVNNKAFMPIMKTIRDGDRKVKDFGAHGNSGNMMTAMLFGDEDAWARAAPEHKALVLDYRRISTIDRSIHRGLDASKRGEISNYYPLKYLPAEEKILKKYGALGDLVRPQDITMGARGYTEGERSTVPVLNEKGDVVLRARFGDSPFEVNQNMSQMRQDFVENFISRGAFSPLQRAILEARGMNPEAIQGHLRGEAEKVTTSGRPVFNKKALDEVSHLLFTDVNTNFGKMLPEWLYQDVQHTKVLQALDWATGAHTKDGPLAIRRDQVTPEKWEQMVGDDVKHRYRMIGGNDHVAVHFRAADPIRDAANATSQFTGKTLAGKLLKLEQLAKMAIVFFPGKHYFNVMGRRVMYALREGDPTTKEGRAALQAAFRSDMGKGIDLSAPSLSKTLRRRLPDYHPHPYDETHMAALREDMTRQMRWHRAGLVPMKAGGHNEGWLTSMLHAHGQSTMDIQNSSLSGITSGQKLPTRVRDALGNLPDGHPLKAMAAPVKGIGMMHDYGQAWLWSRVHQFQIGVAEIALERYKAKGYSEPEAMMLAADEGNAWAGHIRPERWNPFQHAALNTVMFAPNWWRSWAEIMLPLDKDFKGIKVSPELRRDMATQEVKNLAASMMMQHMTGNALNYLMSGHLQTQNSDGNRTKIEVTRPEILDALRAMHNSGGAPGFLTDAILPRKFNQKTGEFEAAFSNPETQDPQHLGLTINNPITAQLESTERMLGDVASGQQLDADQRLKASAAGFVGIAAPTPVAAINAALNVDFYNSLKTGTWQKLDPTGALDTRALAFVLANIGQGQGLGQTNIANQRLSGQAVHPSAEQWGKEASLDETKQLMVQLSGFAAPYLAAEKGQGQDLSTDDHAKIAMSTQKYYEKQVAMSAQAAQTGEFAPWLQQYKTDSLAHQREVQDFYSNTRQYQEGTLGKLNKLDQIYADATDPTTGQVDWAKLDETKKAFMDKLGPKEAQLVENHMKQSEQRIPMLKLYHNMLDEYLQFQDVEAHKLGLDPVALRQQTSDYGKLFGDQRASATFLRDHRQLQEYEHDKRNWETGSPAGLAYGLFYNTSTVNRYLQAQHATRASIADEIEANLGAGGP